MDMCSIDGNDQIHSLESLYCVWGVKRLLKRFDTPPAQCMTMWFAFKITREEIYSYFLTMRAHPFAKTFLKKIREGRLLSLLPILDPEEDPREKFDRKKSRVGYFRNSVDSIKR